jgi:hypothetical protein
MICSIKVENWCTGGIVPTEIIPFDHSAIFADSFKNVALFLHDMLDFRDDSPLPTYKNTTVTKEPVAPEGRPSMKIYIVPNLGNYVLASENTADEYGYREYDFIITDRNGYKCLKPDVLMSTETLQAAVIDARRKIHIEALDLFGISEVQYKLLSDNSMVHLLDAIEMSNFGISSHDDDREPTLKERLAKRDLAVAKLTSILENTK